MVDLSLSHIYDIYDISEEIFYGTVIQAGQEKNYGKFSKG
jgi:hypothetical protein